MTIEPKRFYFVDYIDRISNIQPSDLSEKTFEELKKIISESDIKVLLVDSEYLRKTGKTRYH